MSVVYWEYRIGGHLYVGLKIRRLGFDSLCSRALNYMYMKKVIMKKDDLRTGMRVVTKSRHSYIYKEVCSFFYS